MNRPRIIVLLVVCSLLTISPLLVAAESSYTITVENGEIAVPDQPITVEEQEFTVSAVGVVDPGDDIEVSVAGPDGDYRLHVYDEDRRIVHTDDLSGDDATAFETTNMDAGTYSLVLDEDGAFERIQPFVVAAYETSLSAPAEVTEDEAFTVEIATTEHDGVDAPAIDAVQVVVTTDSMTERFDASETSEGEYVADIDADYDPGEYRLYATASKDNDVDNGDFNVISMSDERTITITEADAETDENGSSGNDGPDGGGSDENSDGTDDQDETNDDDDVGVDDQPGGDETGEPVTEENTVDETEDDDANDDEVDGGTEPEDEERENTETNDDSPESELTESAEENDGVVTPQDTNETEDTADEAPLDGIRLLALAVFSLAMALRLRHRGGD